MRYLTRASLSNPSWSKRWGGQSPALLSLVGLLLILAASPALSETANSKYDLDNNGLNNDADIAVMVDRLNGSGPIADFDLNNDGLLNAADLIELTNYMSGPTQRAVMIPVEAGGFIMGRRDDGDDGTAGAANELPRHTVNLSAYEIGKYEATNGLIAKILNWAHMNGRLEDASGADYSGGSVYLDGLLLIDIDSDRSLIEFDGELFGWELRTGYASNVYSMEYHPAVMISWYGALALCNWLSEMEGLPVCYNLTSWTLLDSDGPMIGIQPYIGYRLPSEAEWERAAAWDSYLDKHWIYGFKSDTLSGRMRANYFATLPSGTVNPLGIIDRPRTAPTGWFNGLNISADGLYAALNSQSPIGCYDMSGNVYEWCYDRHQNEYYNGGEMTDPFGPTTGTARVLKGGGWLDIASATRTARRVYPLTPDTVYDTFGIRFCRSLTDRSTSLGQQRIMLPGGVPMTFVWVPSGLFEMGSPVGERGRMDGYENPPHPVELTRDMLVAETEVTQLQWVSLMDAWPGDGPNATLGEGPNYPAYNISWHDAQSFIAALNDHVIATDQGSPTFRLPTEAEWEYSCRAGTQTRFFFGDSLSVPDRCEDGPAGMLPGTRRDYMWFCGGPSLTATEEVGQLIPNQFGLYDTSGNVREWCQDYFGPYSAGLQIDPVQTIPSTKRVARGGNCNYIANQCRSAVRTDYDSNYRGYTAGFRIVKSALALPGIVEIDVRPDGGSWTLTGPGAFGNMAGTGDRLGISAIVDPPTGEYTLTCDDNVVGLDPPDPETRTLTNGGTIAFTAVYSPEAGDALTILLPGDLPLELVSIPAGSFTMGSEDIGRVHTEIEGPTHTVTLTQDFYAGRTEVTQSQWLALMGIWPFYGPEDYYGRGDDFPAYWMSWDDSQNFIAALNAHISATGQGAATFRLLTEAEWEYACRGGTETRYLFGDSLSVGDECEDGAAGLLPGNRSDYMWYCGNNGPRGTTPTPEYGTKEVGRLLPNQFGLYDMAGNVFEWCQDWSGLYTDQPQTDPEGPTTGTERIRRGGAWFHHASTCRSARRGPREPDFRYVDMGFRVGRTR